MAPSSAFSHAAGYFRAGAGSRAAGRAARDAARRGAAAGAAAPAPPALPVQHAEHHLRADAPRRARGRRMLVRLGDLLRMALDRRSAQEVPLSEELEFLRQVPRDRTDTVRRRLNVRCDIDPETLDALVPNLLLQPLVENSVRHGIAALIGRRDRGDVPPRRRHPRAEGARQRPRALRRNALPHLRRPRPDQHPVAAGASVRLGTAPAVLGHRRAAASP